MSSSSRMEMGVLGWGSSSFALRNHSDDATGAASGSAFAALRISASPKCSSRFQSVFPLRVLRVAIDTLPVHPCFGARRLASADDASAIFPPAEHHRNHVRTRLSVSDDARLAIAEALIQSLDAGAAKDRECIDEVDSMFLPVGPILLRILLEGAGDQRHQYTQLYRHVERI